MLRNKQTNNQTKKERKKGEKNQNSKQNKETKQKTNKQNQPSKSKTTTDKVNTGNQWQPTNKIYHTVTRSKMRGLLSAAEDIAAPLKAHKRVTSFPKGRPSNRRRKRK